MAWRVTTETKSIYLIRDDNVWERLEESLDSGKLRTMSGTIKIPFVPEEKKVMYLWTDPLVEGYERLIITSKVKKVEELNGSDECPGADGIPKDSNK